MFAFPSCAAIAMLRSARACLARLESAGSSGIYTATFASAGEPEVIERSEHEPLPSKK